MARAARPIRFLLAVALGTALLLLLTVLVGFRYFKRAPPHAHEHAALAWHVPVAVCAEAKPEPAAPQRPSLRVEGPTAFVRRLAAGRHLFSLSRELNNAGANRAAVLADFRTLKRFLLLADGSAPNGLRSALRFLTIPRRDRKTLHVRKGSDGLLRVWTTEPGFDARTVQRAETLLRQLVAEAGHPMPEGVDILVTPGMGRDVFPKQLCPAWAAGIYFRSDRYCVVRANSPAGFREQVIRHELVHAYTLGPAGLGGAPRFVSEGLAEYLRFLGPRDGGCNIPSAALCDHLAYLERGFAQAERMGIDLARVNPRHIVHLKPWEFYRLPFGYALALAMHAYVGGEPVARALRSRSPKPLVAALVRVDWPKFRTWLKRQADGGDPHAARFVQDAAPVSPETAPTRATAWQALRAIGAVPPRSTRSFLESATGAMRTPERIDEVIRFLRARDGGPVVFVTDLSSGMDRELDPIDHPAAWREADLGAFATATPRDLVASIHELLRRTTEPALTLLGMTADMRPRRDVRAVESYTPDLLPDWLNRNAEHRMRLVICTAQRSSKRSAARLSRLRDALPASAVVLVIDLAPRPDGDAALLARILAERSLDLHVAYWRP